MFGSTTLDIVLGLILVYLLYSLLVTILGEIVSTNLGIRARMLQKAIERMLNDDDDAGPGKKISGRLKSFFITEPKDFKDTFAGKFYTYPSMKYLARGKRRNLFSKSKPSYISNINFCNTLVYMLREKGDGNDENAKIRYALSANNPLNIQPETLKHLNNLYDDAQGDIEVFKKNLRQWFDDTMDRVTGWYKRRMQLILFLLGLLLAVSFNVDSIQISRILSKDKEARNQMMNMAVAIARDTVLYNKLMMEGDTNLKSKLIETSYGIVKKDIDDANQILALGWGFDKLSLNSKAVLRKSKFKQDVAERLDYLFAQAGRIKSQVRKEQDSLKASSLPGAIEMWEKKIKEKQDSLDITYAAFNSIAHTHFSQIETIDFDSVTMSFVVWGNKPYTVPQKIGYIACQSFVSPKSLIGFLLTALAISLGAPFWFDLLKKLVSIRGAGVKPEEKEEKKKNENKDEGSELKTTTANLSVVAPKVTKDSPPVS